jgi:hypothetical protein
MMMAPMHRIPDTKIQLEKGNRKNLLFIAPDSLPPGISRAFWLAHGLARHFNVYYVQWADSRKHAWASDCTSKSRNRVFISAQTFFNSLFTRMRFERQRAFAAENLIYTYLPIMQKGPISHLSGEIVARKISRTFNYFSLKVLLKAIKFSYVFHGDGLMLSPVLSKNIPAYIDVQDDFDERGENIRLMNYEKQFLAQNMPHIRRKLAITESVAQHMKAFSGFEFEVMPNGADFSAFQNSDPSRYLEIRTRLGLENRFLVSYIGGPVWFDQDFFEKIATLAYHKDPKIHFLTVGNLPSLKPAPNITQVGFIAPELIHNYYLMSDVGILPKNTTTDFLKNSHPLKIIQYSAAKKPVITPIMAESVFFKHDNIFQIEFAPHRWAQKIFELQNFLWSDRLTNEWGYYSWANIADTIAGRFEDNS